MRRSEGWVKERCFSFSLFRLESLIYRGSNVTPPNSGPGVTNFVRRLDLGFGVDCGVICAWQCGFLVFGCFIVPIGCIW